MCALAAAGMLTEAVGVGFVVGEDGAVVVVVDDALADVVVDDPSAWGSPPLQPTSASAQNAASARLAVRRFITRLPLVT